MITQRHHALLGKAHWASVGVFAIVGVTDRSMRSITPASSRRQNKSSGDAAWAAAWTVSAAMPMNTAGSGWIIARLSIHGSLGRTQQIAPGSTPLSSSQMHASVAVFPESTTITYSNRESTKFAGGCVPLPRHRLEQP
jgi:hypothetical protein